MKIQHAFLVTFLPVLSVFADPPAEQEWVVFEPMTDEFNGGELDADKWFDHNPTWKGREPSLFHPDCVAVSNGLLHVWVLDSTESAKRELPEGFTHIAGFVRSKARARFGYFEIRAKLASTSQVSCFWLTHVNEFEWSEIDVVEIPAGIEKYASTLRPNVHYFHGPHFHGTLHNHKVSPTAHPLDFNTSEDFHVYGVEWSPTFIKWYVDGELMREMHNSEYFQPLEMNINMEANSYFGALPKDEELPAVYEIDYVRAWRLKEY